MWQNQIKYETKNNGKTKIQVFKNEMFSEVRTMTNEKGETFFVGKDVNNLPSMSISAGGC